MDGFSLHAALACSAGVRPALEQSFRHVPHPELANELAPGNATGQAVLELYNPCRDGNTHRVMQPAEFMQGLAALIPLSASRRRFRSGERR